MTITACRLVRSGYVARAFDGDGARRFGGRWNSVGVRMVYAAESLSLALLEVLVHLKNRGPLQSYSAIPVHVPSSLIRTLPKDRLPRDWRAWPPSASTQRVGDAWVRAARSAVLAVPSAIIETEHIYLLNPAHPGFRRIRIGTARPFSFDARVLKGFRAGARGD